MTVFVVDDAPAMADTLAEMIRGCGVTARSFYDGQDVLEAASKEPPDFVISDVVMPKMNGFELATELKRRFPACEILLFSGYTAVQLDSPPTEFEILSKPVSPKTLIQRVLAAQTRLEVPPRCRKD